MPTLPPRKFIVSVVPAINLELPTSGSAEPVKYTSIVIAITDQEDIFLYQEETELFSLKDDIKDKISLDGNDLVVPSIIIALKRLGAFKIILSNRTKEKAEDLKKTYSELEIINWG